MKWQRKNIHMDNIRIIQTNIDVSKVLKQLEDNPNDWGSQKSVGKTEQVDPTKYKTTVDVLQLIMGGVSKPGELAFNTETCIKTPTYDNHIEIFKILNKYFKKYRRCAFLKLPVGQEVGFHIDEGTYYLTKDRYHLSIQGKYKYTVGDESIIVEPGTLFWFNNKMLHSAVNIGDVPRITFVFDIPHHKKNP
jgi:hypothetical protein